MSSGFKYRVQSGGMDRTIETPYRAEPQTIVICALMSGKWPKNLGRLVSVTGGHLDDEIYCSTESILIDMGRMQV